MAIMAEGNPRFKFLPSARDSGRQIAEEENVETTVLTDTKDFHIWHKNGSGYQCKRKRSHSCYARVYFDVVLNDYVTTGTHSDHPNDEQEICDRQFKHFCKVQSRETNISYQSIHSRACELYPRANVLLKTIKKSLTQHRHIEQPRNPTSARDAHILLMDNERWRLQKDGSDFYLGEVVWRDPVSGIEESAQVFGNIEVLRVACDPIVKEMNGDGTFSIVPLHFYQLATINTIAYGHSFAAAYFLMTRKTKELYVLAIDLVKQKCQERFGRVPVPTIFVGDYELALLGAAAECFPGCRSRGCWFHSSQAMYRKACNLGLMTAYRLHPIVRRIIRMGMNLPLLKHTHITQGLEAIRRYFDSVIEEIPAENQVPLNQWIAYINDFWINRIGATRFSVYRAVNRTNNFCESGHRTLNECMNGKHLNYYEFIDKLKACGEKAKRDLRNAEGGMLISEPRKLFYKNRDRQIIEKTDQLERELTGIPNEDQQPITEFLRTAVTDNPENYPQNDFFEVDGVPQLDNLNQLLEYGDNAPIIQAAFNILIEAPQDLVPQIQQRNRNDAPAPFPNPIPVVPRNERRVGRPRLHPLPQPRAINHVPRIVPRRGAVYRGARRGIRNAVRDGRRQVDEPVADIDAEPEFAPDIEVDNRRIEQEHQEWEAGGPERERLVQEYRDEVIVDELGVRVFENCTICETHEADHIISCCLQFLCVSCVRNMNIPRVVDEIAMPINICPFCRVDVYVTAPRPFPV